MQKRKRSAAPTSTRRRKKTRYNPLVQRPGRYSTKEFKFFDTALSFSCDTTAEVPATGQLTLIPQGVTESTRVGRKCVIRSIQIRGQLTLSPGSNANAATNSWIYLILDKQCNKSAAALTDVVNNTNLGSAMLNLSNSSRFVVIKRFVISQHATAGVTTAYNQTRTTLDFYKKCSIPIEYSSTTGAIGEITSNNLFLIAGSDGGDDLPTFSGTCRLRFSDG